MDTSNPSYELATLGGGCFWCLEAIFDQIKGVISVTPGYSGGFTKVPSYEDVCTGTTGHAEVVQVQYDPRIIDFRTVLEVFFEVHDPTTLNRQGHDIGTQYRSIILYHSEAQKTIAETMINEINKNGKWKKPIVTEVKPFVKFHPAEEYHHKYFQKNPQQGYCRYVIAPKLQKFLKTFSEKLELKL